MGTLANHFRSSEGLGVRSEAADRPLTELLAAAADGRQDAIDRLWARVYEELRRLATAQMRGEPRTQGLQPTALVHEAYLRLIGPKAIHFENRRHFFAAAAEAMRRIRVDYARTRNSLKRGGGVQHGSLESEPESRDEDWAELLAVNDALARFSEADPVRAEVVKLRYFAGLTVQETAEALGVSPRTVDNHWRVARTWLHLHLTRAADAPIAKQDHERGPNRSHP